VIVGEMIGFDKEELNPEGDEDHKYEFPVLAEAPIEILVPAQIVLGDPTIAFGIEDTVIITESFFVHPEEILVSVK
jgi:hypothetical protein